MRKKETQNKIVDAISPFVWVNNGVNSMGGNVVPRSDSSYDIGTEDRKVRALYVDQIYAGRITEIQSDTTGEGIPTVFDPDDFLHKDGSVTLTGNLTVAASVTIDGVDISAHAANPNAHHNRAHSITSASDHTVSGSQYQIVGLTATNTLGLLTSSNDVTGETSTRILRSTATADTGGAGGVWLDYVGASEIRASSSANITMTPGTSGSVLIPNDKTLRSVTFNPASIPYGGWSIHPRTGMSAQSEMIINRLIADELRVKIFVADETRVDRGTLYVTKGYGLLSRPFTTPGSIGGTSTIYFENSASITGALFSSSVGGSPATSTTGDWLMLQLVDFSGGGANISWFWGRVYNYTLVRAAGTNSDDDPGEQSWTFILKAGDNNVVLPVGSFALNFGQPGQGYIKIDAVSTSFVPAISVLVWGLDTDGVTPLPTATATPYGAGGPDDGAARNMAHMGRLYNALDNDLNIADGSYGFFSTNTYLKGVLRTPNTLLDEKGAQIFTPSQAAFDSFNVFGFRKDGVSLNPLYAYLQGYWDSDNVKTRWIVQDTAGVRDATMFLESFAENTAEASVNITAKNEDTDTWGALLQLSSTSSARGMVQLWADHSINIRVIGAAGASATNRITFEGDLVPNADHAFDLGSTAGGNKRWRNLYAQNLYVDTITSGGVLTGAEWEFSGNMKIDANSASSTNVSIINDGAGVASLTVEGTITAGTGLTVTTGNISLTAVGATVDGVDLSAFKSAYDIHAANATGGSLSGLTEAHHNRSHNIESASDHVISGETTGHVLRVIDGGANTFGFGTIFASVISDFTEAVQDVVGSGAFLLDSSTIDFTYSDGSNTLTAAVIPGGIDHGALADLGADDHTQYMHNTTARTVSAAHTLSNGVLVGLGDAATPAIRFSGDANTGIYSAGADQVNISAGGAARLSISTTTATFAVAISGTGGTFSGNISSVDVSSSGEIFAANGSATDPSYAFTSDSNTGMYRYGADELGFTAGGTVRARLSTSTMTLSVALSGTSATMSGNISGVDVSASGEFFAATGNFGTPSYSFTGDADTGLYNVTTNTLGVTTNGALRLSVSTAAVTSTLPLLAPNGTAGAPSYSFSGDADAGMYSSGTGSLVFSTGGGLRLGIADSAITFAVATYNIDGTVTAPAYSFGADTGMGMYRDSNDVLGFAVNGVEHILVTDSTDTVEISDNLDVVTRVRTPLLASASGALTITPNTTLDITDGKRLRSPSYTSGFVGSGWAIDHNVSYAGKSYAEFDNMTIRGTMNIYELMIQQIRATNGNIFVSSSVKVLDVTVDDAQFGWIHVDQDELAGIVDGDVLRSQRWVGGSSVYISDIVIDEWDAIEGGWRFELIAGDYPEVGFEYARLGNTTNANRRGGLYLSADDAGAPFLDIWNGVDAHSDWNTSGVVKVRLGRLDGITGNTNEYGLFAGNGGHVDTESYIVVSDDDIRLNQVPIYMWNGSVNTGQWLPDGSFYLSDETVTTANNRAVFFEASSGDFRIGKLGSGMPNVFFDESTGTLSIRKNTSGVIVFDSSGNSYFAGRMTIGAGGEIIQGTGTPGTEGGALAAWGTSYTGLRIGRISNVGFVAGYNNSVPQWYGNTDGKFYAGAGSVVLDDDGVSIKVGSGFSSATAYKIKNSSGGTAFSIGASETNPDLYAQIALTAVGNPWSSNSELFITSTSKTGGSNYAKASMGASSTSSSAGILLHSINSGDATVTISTDSVTRLTIADAAITAAVPFYGQSGSWGTGYRFTSGDFGIISTSNYFLIEDNGTALFTTRKDANDSYLRIGYGNTNSRASYIDLHAYGTAPTSWDARIIRNSGQNGTLVISNNGTGIMSFYTNGSQAGYFDSSGNLRAESTFVAAGGAVGSPSFRFAGDTDAGMYLVTAGEIGWSIGGTERMSLTSGTLTVGGVIKNTNGYYRSMINVAADTKYSLGTLMCLVAVTTIGGSTVTGGLFFCRNSTATLISGGGVTTDNTGNHSVYHDGTEYVYHNKTASAVSVGIFHFARG